LLEEERRRRALDRRSGKVERALHLQSLSAT